MPNIDNPQAFPSEKGSSLPDKIKSVGCLMVLISVVVLIILFLSQSLFSSIDTVLNIVFYFVLPLFVVGLLISLLIPGRNSSTNNNSGKESLFMSSKADPSKSEVIMSDDPIRCPKCGSTQIHASDNKNFSLGKAAGGAVLLGPIGLAGGFLGNKSVTITCLRCGHKWTPGKSLS
ncbi:MAG: hypothetical protein PHQ40_21505 [Anaerolineaceae bacterium]|nr:hypothetical protein [Anaerolineaceae bacterium]